MVPKNEILLCVAALIKQRFLQKTPNVHIIKIA